MARDLINIENKPPELRAKIKAIGEANGISTISDVIRNLVTKEYNDIQQKRILTVKHADGTVETAEGIAQG